LRKGNLGKAPFHGRGGKRGITVEGGKGGGAIAKEEIRERLKIILMKRERLHE